MGPPSNRVAGSEKGRAAGIVRRDAAFARLSAVLRRLSALVPELMTWVIALLALIPVVGFFRIAAARVGYPYELEWMEGGIVSHIERVLRGVPLYVEPGPEFTPFIYTPLYYYACAALSSVLGVGYLAPRLVALAACAGTLVLMAWWVWRETRDWAAAVVSAGVFAATYPITGYWFDIARADSLLLLLVLSGGACCYTGCSARSARYAGALLACAFFTKQVGLPLALPPLFVAFFGNWRRGMWAAGTFAAIMLMGIAGFELSSRGWFHYYVFELPAQHAILWANWNSVVHDYFWAPVVPMAIAGLAIVLQVPFQPGDSRRAWLFTTWFLAAAGTSFLSLLHTGGYPNVLMPAYALSAMAFGLVLAWLRRVRAAAPGGSWLPSLFPLAALLLQLQLLLPTGPDPLPTAADVAAGDAVMKRISALPGPVWVTASSYYPVLAGHAESASHTMGVVDVFKGSNSAHPGELHDKLLALIRAKHFGAIVADRVNGFLPPDVGQEISRNYRPAGRVLPANQDGLFWPKTGAGLRPDQIWLPRATPTPP